MKPGDTSIKREHHRAELIHGIFTRVALSGLTYKRAYKQARMLGGARHLRSYKTFERLFLLWKKKPSPETVFRNWTCGHPGQNEPTCWAVVEFAIEHKLSVHAVCKRLDLPISYSTVLRRDRRATEAGRLSKIESARKRLAQARSKSLQIIRGLEA